MAACCWVYDRCQLCAICLLNPQLALAAVVLEGLWELLLPSAFASHMYSAMGIPLPLYWVPTPYQLFATKNAMGIYILSQWNVWGPQGRVSYICST